MQMRVDAAGGIDWYSSGKSPPSARSPLSIDICTLIVHATMADIHKALVGVCEVVTRFVRLYLGW